MTKTLTYTCDRCKKTSENLAPLMALTDEVMGIAVIVQASQYKTSYSTNRLWEKHWCLECLKQFHLAPAPEEEKIIPQPTFEELIGEIVEEALANRN